MPIDVTLTPPSSQSIAKRALVCAALAEGTTVLEGSFISEDLQVMVSALRQIGLKIRQDSKQGRIEIDGLSGVFPVDEEYIDVENSTLTANFLTAVLAFSRGLYRVNGDRRVQQFPMGDLIFALNQLGADVQSENAFDTLPLLIEGIDDREGVSPSSRRYGINSEMSGSQRRYAAMTGTISSQYVCAVLLAAPLAARNCPVALHIVNQLSCDPYVLMTLDVMEAFGVQAETGLDSDDNLLFSRGSTYHIDQGARYQPKTYQVEPDASLANFAFAAAAIAGGRVAVKNLDGKSIQKDLEFIHCLQRMGCNVSFGDNSVIVAKPERSLLRGISVDMFDMTDSISAFAVCALFATSPSRVSNIGHIRRRDPERLPKLFAELRKFGANINEFDDGFLIVPRKKLNPAMIEAEGDARLAMALGLIGLRIEGVLIDSADCVRRAWPTFFDDIGLDF